MEDNKEVKQEEIKPTIWDRYSYINLKGEEATNIKGIIIHLHTELKMVHEALSYMAALLDKEDKPSIITKPDLIL